MAVCCIVNKICVCHDLSLSSKSANVQGNADLCSFFIKTKKSEENEFSFLKKYDIMKFLQWYSWQTLHYHIVCI